MAIKKFGEMDCDEMLRYCPLDSPGVHTPSGYSMCEGSHCKQAYEAYMEECVKCEGCGEEYHQDECEKFTDRSDGHTYWLCEECLAKGDMYG